MAITFEQKQDINKSLTAAVIIIILLAAIGFLSGKYIGKNQWSLIRPIRRRFNLNTRF